MEVLKVSSKSSPNSVAGAIAGVIDFEGFLDGEAFDGGKAENYSLTLGEGQFIPGFEEQIVGHNAGEEFTIAESAPSQTTRTPLIFGIISVTLIGSSVLFFPLITTVEDLLLY